VQDLIGKLDIAVRQVLIEARIVEASDTFGKSLGVRLGGSDLRGINARGGTGYGAQRQARCLGGTYDASRPDRRKPHAADTTNTTFVNLPRPVRRRLQPCHLRHLAVQLRANRFLNLELSALEADGKGKLVSSPRVVTADKTKALIEQGTEFPYQQATSSGATSVAFRRAT
jgi:type IV pilus assembly protein PilQ